MHFSQDIWPCPIACYENGSPPLPDYAFDQPDYVPHNLIAEPNTSRMPSISPAATSLFSPTTAMPNTDTNRAFDETWPNVAVSPPLSPVQIPMFDGSSGGDTTPTNPCPPSSPRSPKDDLPYHDYLQNAYQSKPEARPQRKRRRPRLVRESSSESSCNSSSSNRDGQSTRLLHNRVESKYREGFNSLLDRLHQAVPTLPQRIECGTFQAPKPSKAEILKAAINYINALEYQNAAAIEEIEVLRGSFKVGSKVHASELN